jgi:hypothetical protein
MSSRRFWFCFVLPYFSTLRQSATHAPRRVLDETLTIDGVYRKNVPKSKKISALRDFRFQRKTPFE